MARIWHYEFTLKGVRILGAVLGVFWVAAIALTAVGDLAPDRKPQVLAVYGVAALITAGNVAYRYQQVSKRDRDRRAGEATSGDHTHAETAPSAQ